MRQWTGEWPANRSPKIEALRFANQADRAKAGTRLEAIATVSDRDDDDLTYEWTVMAECTETKHGGDAENVPPSFPQAVASVRGPECSVIFPPPGAYRLFLVVRDGKGGASTANLPFFSE